MQHFTIRSLQLITVVSYTMAFSTFAMEKQHPSTALEDYKLFKVVQRILDISDELRKEFKEKYGTEIQSGRKGWPGSNPCYHQTQQGLFIRCGSYPDNLSTPWGEVKLTGGGCGGYPLGFQAFRQAFFKRLKTRFYAITQSLLDKDKVKFYELRSNDIDLKEIIEKKETSFTDFYKEITMEELRDKVGQETFICSNYCGWDSIYKIDEVEGEHLPEAVPLRRENYEEYNKVNLAWKKLEEKYNEEIK